MRFLFLVLLFYFFLFSCSRNTILSYSQIDEDDFTELHSHLPVIDEKGRVTERFILGGEKSLIDITMFVDSSPSMYPYLHEIGQKSENLFLYITAYNWQMGFPSTDHGDHGDPSGYQENWRHHIHASEGKFGNLMPLENARGKLLKTRILTPRIRDFREIFIHTVSHLPKRDCNRPPYCQGGLEQPLRSAKSFMERTALDNSPNRLLVRQNSIALILLFIANEPERFEDKNRATTASQVAQTFKQMNQMYGSPHRRLLVYSFLILNEDCLDQQEDETEYARIDKNSISKLAKYAEGENISICSKDYGIALRGISKHIKNTLENSVVLRMKPIRETIKFAFHNTPKLQWSLKKDKKRIVFHNRTSAKPVHVSISYKPQQKNK